MERIPYGLPYLFTVPLLSQADTKLFQTTPTLAAGDVKLRITSQAFTALVGKASAFTSGGTAVPVVGETFTGATSAKTATLLGYFLTSGSWAGGDAAGTIFLSGTSGTFTGGENINGSVSGSNVLTLTADPVLQPTALAQAGSGHVAIPLAAAEATTDFGALALVDAAGAEWCSSALEFITVDHPSAGDPMGCILHDAVGTATGQTTTNMRLSGSPAITPLPGMFFRVAAGTGVHQTGRVKAFLNAGGHFDLTPYDTLTTSLDATSVLKVYEDNHASSRVVASEDIGLSATQKADVTIATAAGELTSPAITAACTAALVAYPAAKPTSKQGQNPAGI